LRSGVKTGYDRQDCESNEIPGDKPTLHSFPKDKTLLDKWLKAISRKDFVPSQYSRVCSKHFLPSDFVEVSGDSNVTRNKPKAEKKLMNRYLKKDAVPSIFENVPSYMTGNRTTPRATTKATASSRRQQEADELDILNASFRAQDDISVMTVDEIEQRLSTESTRPTGFKTCVHNSLKTMSQLINLMARVK